MPKSVKPTLSNLSYVFVKLIIIHCFDPKLLWFEVWSALFVPGLLIGRIPLAGASAKGKHYWKYIWDRIKSGFPPLVFATHYPCGWWEGCLERAILTHRTRVVKFLNKMGVPTINIHFSLRNGKLKVIIYDPNHLLESNVILQQVVERAMKFDDRVVKEEELLPGPIHQIAMAEEAYGPPFGNGIIVTIQQFFVGRAIEIVTELSGKRLIPVEPVKIVHRYNGEG